MRVTTSAYHRYSSPWSFRVVVVSVAVGNEISDKELILVYHKYSINYTKPKVVRLLH